MTSLREWILLLVVMMTLQAAAGTPRVHFHRYQLPDYRPQHSNKTQKDYLPVRRPVYDDVTNDDVDVKMENKDRKIRL